MLDATPGPVNSGSVDRIGRCFDMRACLGAVTVTDAGVLFGPAAPGWEPSNTWWLLAPA